jgi:hypothetical protein
MSGPVAAEGLSSRFARLSALDLRFLRVESEAWLCHFGVSPCSAAAPSLNHPAGSDLGEIVDRLSRRLATVPQLRRRALFPGPLRGRPLWVDDAAWTSDGTSVPADVAGQAGGAPAGGGRVSVRPGRRRAPG